MRRNFKSLGAKPLGRIVAAAALAVLAASLVPSSASAAASQNNAPMVVINPGGGIQTNGSDGIRSAFNGAAGYGPSSARYKVTGNGGDQQWYAGTGQWYSNSAPMLQIGGASGQLFGDGGGAAQSFGVSWGVGNVQVVSTTGSAVTAPPGTTTLPSTPTGSGTALIRYTAQRNSRSYVIDRLIEYRYPSPYYTETYTFDIPSGNTEEVKFYQGGDAAPGDSDAGKGQMVTNPRRVLYEINPFSGIFISYGEGDTGSSAFSHWYVGDYYSPWFVIAAGGNLDDTVNPNPGHDAEMDMQWTLGSTPGTYTRVMQTAIDFQDVGLDVTFSQDQIASGQQSNLLIQIVNTTADPATNTGYTYSFPAGLTSQGTTGTPSNTCGGTFATTDSLVSLSGVDLAAGSSCLVTIPVTGPDGRYVVNNQDFVVTGTANLQKGYGSTALTIGTPTYAVNVTKSGSGTGTVTSSPAGINCGSDCTETWPVDQVVDLTATPDSGFVFGGWSGDIGSCVASAAVCQITVDQATTVNAQFAIGRNLTVNKTGSGSGTVTSSPAGINCGSDCTETIADGSSVTLTATAAGGSAFTGWSGDAGSCTSSTTCTLTMNQARTVSAQFAPTRTLTVTKTGAGTGTVTSSPSGINCGGDCTETVADGTTITLTATASGGSVFTGWTGNVPGSCTTASTCAVTMDQARTVTAQFAVGRALTVTTSGPGTGTVTSSPAGIDCGSDCTETIADGSTVTLTAAPGANSAFSKWTGDLGACTDTNPECTLTMDQARTVDAEFIQSWQLAVNKQGSGSGNVTSSPSGIDCGSQCSHSYLNGTAVTLTATPDSGSQLAGWGGACASAGTAATCELSMAEARSVDVTFNPSSSGKPDLRISIGGAKEVVAGSTFKFGIRITNVGSTKPTPVGRSSSKGAKAESLKTCVKVPETIFLVKAQKGAKPEGKALCWTRSSLGTSKWVSYKMELRSSDTYGGTEEFRASASASGASGASANTSRSSKIEVIEPKPKPAPHPPTGR